MQGEMRNYSTILMVVLAGSTLAVSCTRRVPRQAKRKIALGDMAGIKVALKLYRLHCGTYPTTKLGLAALRGNPGSTNWQEPYLERAAMDPWGGSYRYTHPSTNRIGFDLRSAGPDKKFGTRDDITN
jgi:general secretion pathway protein G